MPLTVHIPTPDSGQLTHRGDYCFPRNPSATLKFISHRALLSKAWIRTCTQLPAFRECVKFPAIHAVHLQRKNYRLPLESAILRLPRCISTRDREVWVGGSQDQGSVRVDGIDGGHYHACSLAADSRPVTRRCQVAEKRTGRLTDAFCSFHLFGGSLLTFQFLGFMHRLVKVDPHSQVLLCVCRMEHGRPFC